MITCKNVSFSYGKEDKKEVLSNINFNIKKGEVILLCGMSGCGKTTVTRLINGLIPHYYEGDLKGSVVVDGKNIKDTPLYEISEKTGSVFQNPRSQFFSVDTTSELVFGCENQGIPKEEILNRKDSVVKECDIENLMNRSIFDLSGGEKQKIACAGVSMISPDVVVLDEPTSNLDIEGIYMLKEVLKKWKSEGKTIVISEHRLWFLKGIADRVIYLKDGCIDEIFTGESFFMQNKGFYGKRGLRSVELEEPLLKNDEDSKETMILENAVYSYNGKKEALNIKKLEIPLGKVIAVTGRNGAGKSTFVQCMCGMLKHDKSILTIKDKKYKGKKRMNICFPVMQDVNHQLFTESVLDEVLLSMENEDEEQADKYLKAMDIIEFKDQHPMSLSGGQKQRVAIASALASGRDIIIFDEPTSGLDLKHMNEVATSIKYLKEHGKTVIVVTHDTEFINACCDIIIRLKKGCIEEV